MAVWHQDQILTGLAAGDVERGHGAEGGHGACRAENGHGAHRGPKCCLRLEHLAQVLRGCHRMVEQSLGRPVQGQGRTCADLSCEGSRQPPPNPLGHLQQVALQCATLAPGVDAGRIAPRHHAVEHPHKAQNGGPPKAQGSWGAWDSTGDQCLGPRKGSQGAHRETRPSRAIPSAHNMFHSTSTFCTHLKQPVCIDELSALSVRE